MIANLLLCAHKAVLSGRGKRTKNKNEARISLVTKRGAELLTNEGQEPELILTYQAAVATQQGVPLFLFLADRLPL